MLAGAAILIVLTEGVDVPADISWEAFRDMASLDDICWDMNGVVPDNIPRVHILLHSRSFFVTHFIYL